MLLETIQLMC